MIEPICLDKVISWRGDEDDANKMDDILREVIVIDDDDDVEESKIQKQSNAFSPGKRSRRDSSVEIISVEDLQTQAVDYARLKRTSGQGRSNGPTSNSDDDLPGNGQRRLYRQESVQFDQARLDQMAQHRHQRYEQALNRRRNEAPTNPRNDQARSPISTQSNQLIPQRPNALESGPGPLQASGSGLPLRLSGLHPSESVSPSR